ncbi:uncharacterized protein PHACADRAFT_29210 [Phanerochaete carnosa HHB-10118-sp]|uniref:B30.2/SPRY domain-containing protein n=1 Tax=Phanerochaete carnosa (strain HHB-10118-sp) TaxID=650164 RepID=K5VR28_PHACS|nr:uncharacterized protein PHACADRAFT_29210 [Phanerochaete carnosa HHB-10118-sp]EKM53913.1 hypothetical protein PHACADRAFT_29210 [Phanerochaete carnosa HHB-10118-sp]
MTSLSDLPHARSYLDGMAMYKSLRDPYHLRRELPKKWSTVTYYDAAPDSVISQDGFTIDTVSISYYGAESSRAYVAERCVDPRYPFYYYEVSITSLVFYHSDSDGSNLIAENGSNEALKSKSPPPTALRVWDRLWDDGIGYPGYSGESVAGVFILPWPSTSGGVSAGDILGCGISRSEGRIFYTKNGSRVGKAPLRLVCRTWAHSVWRPVCTTGDSLDISKFLNAKMTRLRPVVYVTLKNRGNPLIPPFLRLRTTANFGQDKFTFDIARFAEDIRQQRYLFPYDARLLPDEVIAMIAAFAAEIIVAEEDV